jgi:hypothetical protein
MATKKILNDLDLAGKIDVTGTVLGSNLSGTNTGDQVSSNFTHDDLSGFVANEHIDWTVDQGATNVHSGNYTDTNTQLTDSQVRSKVSAGTGISYNSTTGVITNTVTNTDTNTQLSAEQVEDIMGAAWINGTNTTFVYDDAAGTLKINSTDTNTQRAIHDTPVDGATTTSISSNWAFDNVKTAVPSGALFTDTNTQNTYVSSDFTHDDLTGFVANEHIDWTTDQGATNIHTGNYTDTNTQLTDAQVRSKISSTGLIGYNSTTGVISTTANNYIHPTHAGDDIDIDTTALTGATVISDLDFNVTTDTLGHVTDANATIATRTLTLLDLGYTGATNANNYVHPTTAGNKHIPTGGTVGQILKNTASGTATWQADNNTTYSVGDGGLSEINFTSADNIKLDGIATAATANGTVTGSGTTSGTNTGDNTVCTSGTATTAATLTTARAIQVSGAVTGTANFDGSAAINIVTTHTADPVITLTGAVTGSGTMTNLGSVSIATTNTADPTLTLDGDATGSATFTNLGNATLTVAIANDSHSHAFNNLSAKTGGTGDYTTTGTFTAATFNATSTTNGGFQGIDADTITAPSFTWTSDQNTGMWHSAADAIGFTTAGVNRITINNSGISGAGAGLTGLNGSNITTGTVAAARVATLNQNTTGSAAKLTTARTIAGTSFDGSANIGITYSNLTGIPSTFAPSSHTLDSHSNVTITANASGEILKWNGSAWINNTLAEAGISAVGHTHTFASLTSKPTTIVGYGITNAYTKTEADAKYLLNTTDTLTGVLTVTSDIETGGDVKLNSNNRIILDGGSDEYAFIVNDLGNNYGKGASEVIFASSDAGFHFIDGETFVYQNVTAKSFIAPTFIGGSLTTSDLNLQTTSGIGAAGADMHFKVGNNGATEAMTILNNGNVGILTNSPGYKLDVNGTVRATGNVLLSNLNQSLYIGGITDSGSDGMRLFSAGDINYFDIKGGTGLNFRIDDVDGGNQHMRLNSSGNLSIGLNNNNNTYKLDVGGTGRFTSTVTATNFILSSDERLKENIKDFDYNQHIDLDVKTYELKSEPGVKRTGVIAQELEVNHPEFVRTDKEGMKSVSYIDLLMAKIAELEARLEKAGI